MRKQVRTEVEAIKPLDAAEGETRRAVLAWIDAGAELCRLQKPATPPRHLVSYCVVVDGQHILLVDHKNAQLWLPTGGHVDPGEHPRKCAVRELREELGIAPRAPVAPPLMITCTTTVGLTAGHEDVSLWYVIEADRQAALQFDEGEFHGVQWFDFDAVPFARADPALPRFIAKLRALKSAPQSIV